MSSKGGHVGVQVKEAIRPLNMFEPAVPQLPFCHTEGQLVSRPCLHNAQRVLLVPRHAQRLPQLPGQEELEMRGGQCTQQPLETGERMVGWHTHSEVCVYYFDALVHCIKPAVMRQQGENLQRVTCAPHHTTQLLGERAEQVSTECLGGSTQHDLMRLDFYGFIIIFTAQEHHIAEFLIPPHNSPA
eukprot:GDKI01003307.1.p1 GENE.GDKI01003307.1~~GDKI01003307.1.p1  ORF type:complete len:203 (+),score=39.58 GDKI01003307.1:54-611(+)